MANFNEDKKTYIGKYKGVKCWGVGCMIGNNWYGKYYCTKLKNGRNYKVKDSCSDTVKDLKEYIDRNLADLNPSQCRVVLKIYWEDGVTVEERKFDRREDAERYVSRNGITEYSIENA